MTRPNIYHAAICALALFALPACVVSAAGNAVGTVAKVGVKGAGMAAKGVVGGARLGARGAGAVLTDDPAVSKRILSQRAGRELGYNRRDLAVSDIYEDENRTDYVVTAPNQDAFYCIVLEVDGTVSDAVCEEIPDNV